VSDWHVLWRGVGPPDSDVGGGGGGCPVQGEWSGVWVGLGKKEKQARPKINSYFFYLTQNPKLI
jgi:hypothetical protein